LIRLAEVAVPKLDGDRRPWLFRDPVPVERHVGCLQELKLDEEGEQGRSDTEEDGWATRFLPRLCS
jgi:hypothetical protein